MVSFPSSIASFTAAVDYETVVDASIDNGQWAEIVAIETVLGINPATVGATAHVEGTVGYNIDVLYSDVTTLQTQVTDLTGGTIISVTAADTSVVVTTTSQNVTIKTATLDVVATQHPAAANWSNNSHKITSLANGTVSTDAAAFGQIPVIDASAANAVGQTASAGSTGQTSDGGHVHAGVTSVTGSGVAVTGGNGSGVGAITVGPKLPRSAVITNVGNTYTPNVDVADVVYVGQRGVTGPATNFAIENPTGTAHDGQGLLMRIWAEGAFTIGWGGAWHNSGLFPLPTTSLNESTMTLGFLYDAESGVWILLAADTTGY